eukprot:TRINITY_DN6654_c0_g1_i1.p1 TRINITY_DN6654_c0_g1~~TRINITY_DN6654_c0_g1_i1.p1  ORF type:complete len:410 (-),score=38.00 TRINITY_DN6654_c0_g1_i1:9-1238(-)
MCKTNYLRKGQEFNIILVVENKGQNIMETLNSNNDLFDLKLWDVQNELFKERPNQLQLHYERHDSTPKKEQPTTKKYKWSVEHIDESATLNFQTAIPIDDITQITWTEQSIKCIQRSETGAEGVFFIENNKSEVFVVKPSRNIACEIFSNLIAQKLGVYCPKLRVIYTGPNTEGFKLVQSIKEHDKRGLATHNLGQSGYLLIKQFVPGRDLTKCDYEAIRKYYGTEVDLNENFHKKIGGLARILALDLLLNYSDRLPFIWANQGNSGNVMITNQGQFISIENSITPFDPSTQSKKFQDYQAQVKKLFSKLLSSPRGYIPEFENIQQKFLEFTDYSWQQEGTVLLQLAMVDFLIGCTTINIDEQLLSQWRDILIGFNPPLVGIENVNVNYVLEMWKTFVEFGLKFKENKH